MISESRREQSKRSRKAPSSAWKPGQSGNPGGRPKVAAEVRELARQHGYEAIQRLVALLHSANETVSLRAAEVLLDRAYGRPLQGLELNSVDASPQRWHVEIVPMPKPENTPPSSESLSSQGMARLLGPSHPAAGTIISCEGNGEVIPSSQQVTM